MKVSGQIIDWLVGKRRPPNFGEPGPDWHFINNQFRGRGVKEAWDRDVGLDDKLFKIGVSGGRASGRFRAIAFTKDWYENVAGRRYFVYSPSMCKWTEVLSK